MSLAEEQHALEIPAIVPQVLGDDGRHSPFLAEAVAMDVTSALRAAEVGLRSFRSRPLLRRLWDGVTGDGARRLAAVGSDLVTVQRATLSLVEAIMGEEIRTRSCLEKVLHNLHAVNADLDRVEERVTGLEAGVLALHSALRSASARLAEEILRVERLTAREGALRRLRDLYLAERLHPWGGPLLQAALFLGSVRQQLTAEDGRERIREEWEAASAVVERKLAATAERVPLQLLAEIEALPVRALEPAAYLFSRRQGPTLESLGTLVRRRLAGLTVDLSAAEDAVTVARALSDPDGHLGSRVRRPADLAGQIARELLDQESGGEP